MPDPSPHPDHIMGVYNRAPLAFERGEGSRLWSTDGEAYLDCVAGIAVNKLAFHGEHTAFIMELPLYHIPNARTVGLYVWNNTVSFVRKAGSLILIASMVVWALSSLPGGDVDRSILCASS